MEEYIPLLGTGEAGHGHLFSIIVLALLFFPYKWKQTSIKAKGIKSGIVPPPAEHKVGLNTRVGENVSHSPCYCSTISGSAIQNSEVIDEVASL